MVKKHLVSNGIRTHDLPTEHHLDQLRTHPLSLFSPLDWRKYLIIFFSAEAQNSLVFGPNLTSSHEFRLILRPAVSDWTHHLIEICSYLCLLRVWNDRGWQEMRENESEIAGEVGSGFSSLEIQLWLLNQKVVGSSHAECWTFLLLLTSMRYLTRSLT